MNEDDITSSCRVFVKIMMQEVTESSQRTFVDPEIEALCTGTFPFDSPKTRASINYFTSFGLGALTKELRERLKVNRPFNDLCYTRADVLFPRTPLA